MSIRPTDLQIIVQKAHEVERLQQNQQQQSKIQQQQFAEQLHKQSETKNRQINSSPHAGEVLIRQKERDADKGSPSKRERQQNGSDSAKLNRENETGTSENEHIIDIKA